MWALSIYTLLANTDVFLNKIKNSLDSERTHTLTGTQNKNKQTNASTAKKYNIEENLAQKKCLEGDALTIFNIRF